MGWRLDGMNPARRAVLTAKSAIAWSGSGGPRCFRWFGLAMCTARTWISSRWTTVRAGVEPAVLDPRAGFQGAEPLLDQPPFLVPSGDAERVFRRGFALGGQEQPVERLLVLRRPPLQHAHGEHAQRGRVLRRVGRRDEIDEPGPQLELHALASLALPGAAAGLDVDRLRGHDVKPSRVFEQVRQPAVRREGPPPARTVGADQDAGAIGSVGGGAAFRQQRPCVAFPVAEVHHTGPRTGGRQLGGLVESVQPAAALRAFRRPR